MNTCPGGYKALIRSNRGFSLKSVLLKQASISCPLQGHVQQAPNRRKWTETGEDYLDLSNKTAHFHFPFFFFFFFPCPYEHDPGLLSPRLTPSFSHRVQARGRGGWFWNMLGKLLISSPLPHPSVISKKIVKLKLYYVCIWNIVLLYAHWESVGTFVCYIVFLGWGRW